MIESPETKKLPIQYIKGFSVSGLKQPMSNQQYPSQFSASFQNNDEIDLREVFKAIWEGKLIIAAITMVFSFIAVFFAMNAQEWWSSTAQISKSQPQDIAIYEQQVKLFQPVFDVYQQDGTVLINKQLDRLIDSKMLFQQYLREFNSKENKRLFFRTNTTFKAIEEQLYSFDSEVREDSELFDRKVHEQWFDKINVTATDKIRQTYNVSFQSTDKESSSQLLNDYMQEIKRKVYTDAWNNLQATIDSKRNELIQQRNILENQAKNKISIEVVRAKYALSIAKAAGVNRPMQISSEDEIFGIDLGSKALEQKIKVLKSVESLSIFEPRLQQIDAKLQILKDLKINNDVEFQSFHFIENIEKPTSRDKPKRAFMVLFGGMFGAIIGVLFVLVGYAFRK